MAEILKVDFQKGELVDPHQVRNQIETFMHCHKCMEELPQDKSPREYALLEVGWTERGLQVWCKRHECNVGLFDTWKTHVSPALAWLEGEGYIERTEKAKRVLFEEGDL